MQEITAPTEALMTAAKQPLKLYQSIRAMRDDADIQLNTRRVFTCVAKFGETVLGDALAIFDEFTFPPRKGVEGRRYYSFHRFFASNCRW